MPLQPRHTTIVELFETPFGTLVREDYYCYPMGESNVYLLDSKGTPLWFAERPLPDDAYANRIVNLTDKTFECGSWEGFTCKIGLSDGKIIDSMFTK
jgi:hypothetical protein